MAVDTIQPSPGQRQRERRGEALELIPATRGTARPLSVLTPLAAALSCTNACLRFQLSTAKA
jgi:hypothetical protein